MIRILLSTKLGEMKWSQADLARATGIRPNTISELYHEYTDKITIPPFLAEELKEYCSHLYGIMPNERMFRFTKSYMEHEIVRGIKETGVKRIRIHDLRHSHASLLVELGFQPLAIADRLGHEKIETTLNTYSHLYPNKQAELANRLELENEEDNL